MRKNRCVLHCVGISLEMVPWMMLWRSLMVMMPPWIMYEEIMAAFPEAKFLLTISDAESWFENFFEIARVLRASHRNDTCLKNYYRHIQRVQDVIPPERLLVYNWSDGWSPLSFLGDLHS
ncbi:unnamed protein product [Cladocopium goreaui]|uniref:Uncharacterized protein n=1 Tax=Cladocopium goreaui TaxID=2562237 RepID=A0A9P1BWW4_9DINO|nr:unnamed protein product [Cladocopium goreaui]